MRGTCDGEHQYDIVGEYLDNPEEVFVPATKAMFALCVLINEKGGKL